MIYGKVHSTKKGFYIGNVIPKETMALIPDTNILLYLINKDEYLEFIIKLDSLVWNNRLLLLIPSQVINEFNNNLETIIERKKEAIRQKIKQARSLTDYYVNLNFGNLDELSPRKEDEFSKLLDLLEDNKERVFLRNLYRKVNCLKSIFKHKAIIIETRDEVKLQVTDMALEKKAPFFGGKSSKDEKDTNKLSSGDAIIFLTIYKHLKENTYKQAIFLTENAGDFCKAGKKHILHENLEPLAKEVSLEYSINIAKTINDVIKQLNYDKQQTDMRPVSQKVVDQIEKVVTSDCPFCNNPDAIVRGGWRQSLDGLSWHHNCMNCGQVWDTGDLLDM